MYLSGNSLNHNYIEFKGWTWNTCRINSSDNKTAKKIRGSLLPIFIPLPPSQPLYKFLATPLSDIYTEWEIFSLSYTWQRCTMSVLYRSTSSFCDFSRSLPSVCSCCLEMFMHNKPKSPKLPVGYTILIFKPKLRVFDLWIISQAWFAGFEHNNYSIYTMHRENEQWHAIHLCASVMFKILEEMPFLLLWTISQIEHPLSNSR